MNLQPGFIILDAIPTVRILYLCQVLNVDYDNRVQDECIVLGDLWKEDSTFGGRIFVSGTHSVHGYRSQHLQLDGQIGEQYLVDALLSSCLGYLLPNPMIKTKHVLPDSAY